MGLRTDAAPGFVRSAAGRVRSADGGLNVDEVLDDLAPQLQVPGASMRLPVARRSPGAHLSPGSSPRPDRSAVGDEGPVGGEDRIAALRVREEDRARDARELSGPDVARGAGDRGHCPEGGRRPDGARWRSSHRDLLRERYGSRSGRSFRRTPFRARCGGPVRGGGSRERARASLTPGEAVEGVSASTLPVAPPRTCSLSPACGAGSAPFPPHASSRSPDPGVFVELEPRPFPRASTGFDGRLPKGPLAR